MAAGQLQAACIVKVRAPIKPSRRHAAQHFGRAVRRGKVADVSGFKESLFA
jgi:hypothetical protein